ncbi:LysR family transcriptional regulator [Paenibacillus sp. HN-1]|uniref:LysR family transcriptional regulator n=1 Tax=Paenibacillus TaxID=44249 RepID=UPI001CA7F00F|nr:MULTISPECIES: LysR family transcriptional regulator [Paenibacillus]MBY9078025.1 LysR family transcriptional regulator [Paenibacillus sp. CGMCC 1.18879]MBY9083766.1 LysR family transcriptional regulator [Paenibacillus sinensis]
MDLRALHTFHQIVKHGSFIRAAEELSYAQSTVTMQMQKLESELGMQLFERGKSIRLTEAGRLLAERSRHLLQNMVRLEEEMAGLAQGSSGHLRLGVTEPTASYRLPSVIRAFTHQYPDVKFSLLFGNTPHLSELLQRGDLDLALCSAPDTGKTLHFEPLFREEFVMLLPEGHPLEERQTLSPEDFEGHRLLITSDTCPYRRKLELILREAGGIAPDTMEIGSMTALKAYVAEGLGMALVPRITVDPVPAGTVIREVAGGLVEMTFGILSSISLDQLKPVGYRFIHVLKEKLAAW